MLNRRNHPITGRDLRFVEASEDRVLTDPAFYWIDRTSGERFDATDEEIGQYLGDFNEGVSPGGWGGCG